MLGSSVVFLGQLDLKAFQAVVPKTFVLRKPIADRSEELRDEAVAAFAAFPTLAGVATRRDGSCQNGQPGRGRSARPR